MPAASPVSAGTPSPQSCSKRVRSSASAASASARSAARLLDRLGIPFGLVTLGAQLGLLGLERGDHPGVDRRAQLAIHTATALGQQRELAPGLLPQRLVAHQRVAHVTTAQRGQLRFCAQHQCVQLGQGGAQLLVLTAQLLLRA